MEQHQSAPHSYSVEEYLELEEQSETRHEYYHGEVFAMAGASLSHNRIIRNGSAVLLGMLSMECEVFIDGALLKVDPSCFLYPDLSISCHPNDLAADRILEHPSVIVEVLSPSSADYDRTYKLRLYQQVPDLRHYVLVRQDYCWVECLTRQVEKKDTESEWTLQVYDKLTDELHLSALGIRVPLKALYARVRLEQPQTLLERRQ